MRNTFTLHYCTLHENKINLILISQQRLQKSVLTFHSSRSNWSTEEHFFHYFGAKTFKFYNVKYFLFQKRMSRLTLNNLCNFIKNPFKKKLVLIKLAHDVSVCENKKRKWKAFFCQRTERRNELNKISLEKFI